MFPTICKIANFKQISTTEYMTECVWFVSVILKEGHAARQMKTLKITFKYDILENVSMPEG